MSQEQQEEDYLLECMQKLEVNVQDKHLQVQQLQENITSSRKTSKDFEKPSIDDLLNM